MIGCGPCNRFAVEFEKLKSDPYLKTFCVFLVAQFDKMKPETMPIPFAEYMTGEGGYFPSLFISTEKSFLKRFDKPEEDLFHCNSDCSTIPAFRFNSLDDSPIVTESLHRAMTMEGVKAWIQALIETKKIEQLK